MSNPPVCAFKGLKNFPFEKRLSIKRKNKKRILGPLRLRHDEFETFYALFYNGDGYRELWDGSFIVNAMEIDEKDYLDFLNFFNIKLNK